MAVKMSLQNNQHLQISNKYFGPIRDPATLSGSFLNLKRALKPLKVSRKNFKNFLQKQHTYTLHKEPKRNFQRNHYHLYGPFQIFEIDILDMQKLKGSNKNYRYIFCCIDAFTKMCYLEPLKSKAAFDVTEAFKKILNRCGSPVKRVLSDRGKEFLNKQFRDLLIRHNIEQTTPDTVSAFKCAHVERFQRTLQALIYRFFTFSGHTRWLDSLRDFEMHYNLTWHSTIKMPPAHVNTSNVPQVYSNIRERHRVNDKKHLSKASAFNALRISDFVRVVLPRISGFEKGYTVNWSKEIYQIYKIIPKSPENIYFIKDLYGKELTNRLYRHQLQRVLMPFTLKLPLKILKTRGLGNELQYSLESAGNSNTSNLNKEKNSRWYNYKQLDRFKNDQLSPSPT